MTVFMTGASGFIGSHVTPLLRSAGWNVHAIARRRGDADVAWHEVDLHDRPAVAALIAAIRPTHLLHLAWNAIPGQFWTTQENLRWLESSVALIEAFAAAGGRRVVIAGTCAEYASTKGACVEEETPLVPSTLYGAAKHALHTVAREFSRHEGISLAWGRIFHPYGAREPAAKLIPAAIQALLRGDTFDSTAGDQLRDFIHVSDCASAFEALLDSEVEGAFNIGTGRPVTVAHLLSTIARELNAEKLLRLGALPRRQGEAQAVFADTSRIRSTGWSDEVSLHDGLVRTIEYWRSVAAS